MSVIIALSSPLIISSPIVPRHRCGDRRTPVVVVPCAGLYRLYEGEIKWP